jgi:hypothetical protein
VAEEELDQALAHEKDDGDPQQRPGDENARSCAFLAPDGAILGTSRPPEQEVREIGRLSAHSSGVIPDRALAPKEAGRSPGREQDGRDPGSYQAEDGAQ